MRKAHHPDPEIIGPAEGHEARVRSRFWKTVRKAVASIPFIDEVVAAYYCALDPETPASVRANARNRACADSGRGTGPWRP